MKLNQTIHEGKYILDRLPPIMLRNEKGHSMSGL